MCPSSFLVCTSILYLSKNIINNFVDPPLAAPKIYSIGYKKLYELKKEKKKKEKRGEEAKGRGEGKKRKGGKGEEGREEREGKRGKREGVDGIIWYL